MHPPHKRTSFILVLFYLESVEEILSEMTRYTREIVVSPLKNWNPSKIGNILDVL